MPTGMTTPVEMVLKDVPEAVVAVFAVVSSSSPAAPLVKLEDDSVGAPKSSPEDAVSAPPASAFWVPALVPVPVSALASASCTDLSSAALFNVVLAPAVVSATAVADVASAAHRDTAASTAISDMCEVIRRIVFE